MKTYENIILTRGVDISPNAMTRNDNVFSFGESCEEIENSLIAPNILQGNASCVILDNGGRLLANYGDTLRKMGYKVMVFNPMDSQNSVSYNPFHYLRDKADVEDIVSCLIKNYCDTHIKTSEFWDTGDDLLLKVFIFYLIEKKGISPKRQNFSGLLSLMSEWADNPDTTEMLDCKFKELEAENPDSLGVISYKKLRAQFDNNNVMKSFFVSCALRLSMFNSETVRKLCDTDTVDLSNLRNEKTALFILREDNTFDALYGMLLSDALDMPKTGDYPLKIMTGDVANLPYVPNLLSKIATSRKYKMSYFFGAKSIKQLREKYLDWRGIIQKFDSILYFGTSDEETIQYVLEQFSKCKMTMVGEEVKGTSIGGETVSLAIEEVLPENHNCLGILGQTVAIIDECYDASNHPNANLQP